ncbi:hypothetical protein D7D52_33095 [Nocardia yunnanensis]|uniref:Uncharacterized protein n=1 Tax=Nocardia yunnanensis TaxID=2382165 RepID=A0A386ZMQ2_9NOCA|nr:hypothetical protein [Nocardia yunnanensis]AYF77855.1 hypothetical protein D7D52_33095 [Nocardia yunnanensis]
MDWFMKPARTYSVRDDGRVELRVILTVGDDAHVVTPWHSARRPMIVSAAEIALDCDMPVNEVPGRELTADGDQNGLHDFRLVHDPRL